jgi:hypothetical protein
MKEKPRLKICLIVLGIVWAVAFVIATLQVYLMSNSLIAIPIGLAVSAGIFYLHLTIYNNLIKGSVSAKIILYSYIALNFVPLILQLAGFKAAGIDNIIAAAIGLALYYFYVTNISIRDHPKIYYGSKIF